MAPLPINSLISKSVRAVSSASRLGAVLSPEGVSDEGACQELIPPSKTQRGQRSWKVADASRAPQSGQVAAFVMDVMVSSD